MQHTIYKIIKLIVMLGFAFIETRYFFYFSYFICSNPYFNYTSVIPVDTSIRINKKQSID